MYCPRLLNATYAIALMNMGLPYDLISRSCPPLH